MEKFYHILVINPGSTSTKLSLFKNEKMLFTESIAHSSDLLKSINCIIEQYEFREKVIYEFLEKKEINLNDIDATVGRGGLLRPLPSGTYRINKKMINHLRKGLFGEHASNLGAILAYQITKNKTIPAYIVDPVVVDEMGDIARISGIPLLPRKSIFHALNQKAVARKAASDLGKNYQDVNFIVVHMGGGISVGIHQKGRVVDVNNALNGEGPFSPERSGSVPVGDLAKLCFSGKYSQDKIMAMIKGEGGLVAYLNTNDVEQVIKKIKAGEKKAKLILEAMAYQISKQIGEGATALKGNVDAIILTGGISHSNYVVEMIKDRVSFIALVMVYPGEEEMLSLCQGALRVLKGEEEEKIY
ncbi:MAG: butyrate kinase [Atribacterota bacterium]|nr:butyrate kinase [Atribacterota bacterium]MDD4895525.1 butyrate kinase [Atribacterota bacterium]MDD5637703.1 butyrate kinase [Atribacterota bacterium]